MTYRILGLAPEGFKELFALSDEALHERGARRILAGEGGGYPCRVSLEDAEAGEELILLNYASHDVSTPFRTTYAIYVREQASEAARFEDEIPPLLASRTLSLRGFDSEGMLHSGELVMPGEADRRVRAMFDDPAIATIHAHSAAYGCFLVCVERSASC